MKKISALMLLLLSCLPATYSSQNFFQTPGMTQQEVAQRHRIVYRGEVPFKLEENKGSCNGFAMSGTTIYTAEHCVNGFDMFLGDGTALEKLVSFPERDLAILSTNGLDSLFPKVPFYPQKLEKGDEVYFIVSTDPEKRKELLRKFPDQVKPFLQGLLEIRGNIVDYSLSRTLRDNSCRPFQLLNTYTSAAPGQLGFSGSPVLIKRDNHYNLAGFSLAVERQGMSHCSDTIMTRDAITFTAVSGYWSTQLVRAERLR